MMLEKGTKEMMAADNLRRWREKPTTMVRELFEVEPDAWQAEALDAFPSARRMAMKACTGPGKTAVLAWLGWNFLLTRPHPKIGATSTTGGNLKSNLWPELNRWYQKAALLRQLFEITKTMIYSREFPETWSLEARTWPKEADPTQIGNALAGLHAEYVMWLLDESGDYPDSIMPVCEGIFTGNPKEAHIVQAGNPTHLSGPLYRACTAARNIWKVIEITADPDDPKRTPRVSVDVAREQIAQYGRDNPWILVRIFGQFPPSSPNALIGPDEVSAAMKRMYRDFDYRDFPKVLGVDVAREGDDASVIFKRQGIQCFPMAKYRNITGIQGAGAVSRIWDDWGADAVFVDSTGGFGSSWIDQLHQLGKPPIGIHFSNDAHDKRRYFNKRTEMYFDAVEWIRRGGALPESAEILAALTQTNYSFKGDRLLLEPKEFVKKKIGYSPDEADAFILTFAEPVSPKARQVFRPKNMAEYDPLSDQKVRNDVGLASAIDASYDPFNSR